MASPDQYDPLADLAFAIGFVNNLEDLGIDEVTYWRVWSKCSQHGVIHAIWDDKPKPGDMLSCGECHDPKRKCLIYACNPDSRPK